MRRIMILTGMLLMLASCKKFLDEQPDKSIVIPGNLKDFQSLLDDATRQNYGLYYVQDIASDNMYLLTSDWLVDPAGTAAAAYVWSKDIFSTDFNCWTNPYESIKGCNVVLDGLTRVDSLSQPAIWNNCKGSALFYRAQQFWQLAQIFCKPYQSTAASDPGVVLSLIADLNARSQRATVQETYDRIIADLKSSLNYLPVSPLYKTRPCKPAAYALMARTFLLMGRHAEAGLYADSCLQLSGNLIDYNTLSTTALLPFLLFNDEVIWHASSTGPSLVVPTQGKVDTVLYKSYVTNDLRKTIFFKPVTGGFYSCYGNYTGTNFPFGGIATDEVYLIRAEAAARTGNISAAMNDLNKVLVKRWKTGTFVAYTASSAQQALQLVLQERRKELAFRGLRWSDLKRLNLDPAFQVTITKTVNNQVYVLPPNDPRYQMAIPQKVIELSGIEQNP
jgi:hypothetical protein